MAGPLTLSEIAVIRSATEPLTSSSAEPDDQRGRERNRRPHRTRRQTQPIHPESVKGRDLGYTHRARVGEEIASWMRLHHTLEVPLPMQRSQTVSGCRLPDADLFGKA